MAVVELARIAHEDVVGELREVDGGRVGLRRGRAARERKVKREREQVRGRGDGGD